MKTLIKFLLIGISAALASCDDTIDYIYYHKVVVVNNTESVVVFNADTMSLTVAPHESAESDFDFGDKFLWGYHASSITVADSLIDIPYENQYTDLRGFFTEVEYDTRKYTNTFEVDDEWVRRLWRSIHNVE